MPLSSLYFDLYIGYFLIAFVIVANIYAIAQLPMSFKDSTSVYQKLQRIVLSCVRNKKLSLSNKAQNRALQIHN